MRKTVLTILAASLIAGSTVQIAGAAERYAHKSDRARVHTTEQFRNANDSLPWRLSNNRTCPTTARAM
jgi:hypothetical protein